VWRFRRLKFEDTGECGDSGGCSLRAWVSVAIQRLQLGGMGECGDSGGCSLRTKVSVAIQEAAVRGHEYA